MMWTLSLLAQEPQPKSPTDIVAWLLWALAACCSALVGMVSWYMKIKEPRNEQNWKEASLLHAQRYDQQHAEFLAMIATKDAEFLKQLREQRDECRAERMEQWKKFVETLDLIQEHSKKMNEVLTEEFRMFRENNKSQRRTAENSKLGMQK